MKYFKKRNIAIFFAAKLIFGAAVLFLSGQGLPPFQSKTAAPKASDLAPNVKEAQSSIQEIAMPQEITFVGPRDNIPKDAPKDYGFWSFAYSDVGALSRSGQPTSKDFQWLKDNGWKSVINLRADGEYGENADDSQLPGFDSLGFNYLRIPVDDGGAPTDEQGDEFLKFVTNPDNLPVHVHCRAGIGRAGAMVALYRYSVQGWPMDKALEESLLFRGGVSNTQRTWLEHWAQTHQVGDYSKA